MASGGSSVHSAAGSRSFDFGSDDVLCSFDDYTLQLDPMANGKRFDSSTKDLHENRVRSPSANIYGQSEEFSREDVIYIVEKCMEKYSDKLTMHLEGISGRLTQLELYCYKLERSISEFHTDVIHDQSETNLKLKSLDKHVREVHRSVQIIRDKQELFETQNELTKLQLSQKDSFNVSYSQKTNKDMNTATSEIKANYKSNDVLNQQLALALPCPISSPPPSISTSPHKNHPEQELPLQQSLPVSFTVLPQDHYVLNQANAYYYTQHQPLLMEQQSQTLQPELHYAQQRVEIQDLSVQPPPNPEQNMAANQHTHQAPFLQYQQHWSQPRQPQQSSPKVQSPRFQTPPAYPPYALNQPSNKIPEAHQGSSILLPPQHNMQRQLLPQACQGSFVSQPLADCGYLGTSTYPSLGYKAVYVDDGNRTPHLQNYHLGSYPPNGNAAASLVSVNHPYANMIEKEVGIGYPRDQLVGIVLGTAESG